MCVCVCWCNTDVDVGVVLDELRGDVGHTLVRQVLHVAVPLPVPVRTAGISGSRRGVGHSGRRHHTHRLACTPTR